MATEPRTGGVSQPRPRPRRHLLAAPPLPRSLSLQGLELAGPALPRGRGRARVPPPYRSASLKHESRRPACWRGRRDPASEHWRQARADRGGPEAAELPRLIRECFGLDREVAGPARAGLPGAIAGRQSAAWPLFALGCSSLAGRSCSSGPSLAPGRDRETGALSAARAGPPGPRPCLTRRGCRTWPSMCSA